MLSLWLIIIVFALIFVAYGALIAAIAMALWGLVLWAYVWATEWVRK